MSKEVNMKANMSSSAKQVASSQTSAAPVVPQVVVTSAPPPGQVVMTNPGPAVLPFFPSPYSQIATCPRCHFKVSTSIDYVNGTMVWAVCMALFLPLGVFGCCLIPFCVNGMKDVQHFCPQCGQFIGEYRRC